jgi:hypothetical protein
MSRGERKTIFRKMLYALCMTSAIVVVEQTGVRTIPCDGRTFYYYDDSDVDCTGPQVGEKDTFCDTLPYVVVYGTITNNFWGQIHQCCSNPGCGGCDQNSVFHTGTCTPH